MGSNEESGASPKQLFTVGALALVSAFVVYAAGWWWVDRVVAPGPTRGALRFGLLCLGIAIIGTIRRQLTAKRGTASRPST